MKAITSVDTFLILIGCGTSVSTGPLPGGITKSVISPQQTNPDVIKEGTDDYYVFSRRSQG